MSQSNNALEHPSTRMHWKWPIQIEKYDRGFFLTFSEAQELEFLNERRKQGKRTWFKTTYEKLDRLLLPLQDVFNVIGASKRHRSGVTTVILKETYSRSATLWAWSSENWVEILKQNTKSFADYYHVPSDTRKYILVVAYFLGCSQPIVPDGQKHDAVGFAGRIFGSGFVDSAIKRVHDQLLEIGYGEYRAINHVPQALCRALVVNQSPFLEDLTLDTLEKTRQRSLPKYLKTALVSISTALVGLKILKETVSPNIAKDERYGVRHATEGVNPEWVSWCVKWQMTSTLVPESRMHNYYSLLKVGRWLTQKFPDVTSPNQWTREIAIELVATVDRR